MSQRILVTGGAGFIGSHICLTLLQNNYEVFVIDSLINGYFEALTRVKYICNDVGNTKQKLHFNPKS